MIDYAAHASAAASKALFRLLVLGVAASAALVAANKGDLAPNGNHARPFYIFAHNPNLKTDIADALNAGANALEPDVNRFTADQSSCAVSPGPSGLFIHHNPSCVVGEAPIVTLEDYLDEVYNQVKNHNQNLALVVLDIKPKVSSSVTEFHNLISAVKLHLNHDGVNIPVIFSVGTTAEAVTMFQMAPTYYLTDNMGLMVDGEYTTDNDAYGVFNTLLTAYQTYQSFGPFNLGFGNGAVDLNVTSTGGLSNVFPNIDQAVFLRSSADQVSPYGRYAIPYAYTMYDPTMMREFIASGVDGLIPDAPLASAWSSTSAGLVRALNGIVAASPEVYLATGTDNIFRGSMEAYGVKVTTDDTLNAGTNSKLTFTLRGSCGISQVQIDAGYAGRMERGQTNYVTIPSMNIGTLSDLQIHSDGSGSAPGWIPRSVEVSSRQWGIPATLVNLPSTSIGGSGEPNTVIVNLSPFGVGSGVCGPTVSPYQTPAANAAGWTNSSAATYYMPWKSFTGFTASQTNCPASFSIANVPDGAPFVRTFSCQDNKGQVGYTTWILKVDTTAPVASPSQTPPPNAAGWTNTTQFTIHPNWSDPYPGFGSGLPAPAGPNCTVADAIGGIAKTLNPVTFSYSCQDIAGNTGRASWTVKWDINKPDVQCRQPDSQWRKSYTEVCTATDDVSGVKAPAAATKASLSPDGKSATLEFTLAGTAGQESSNNSLHEVVCDVADNCAQVSVNGIKLDNKAPVITIASPVPNKVYTKGVDTLTLNYTVTDGGSGVGALTETLNGSNLGAAGASGQTIDLRALAPGQYRFQIDASDKLLNHSSSAVTFTVAAGHRGGKGEGSDH